MVKIPPKNLPGSNFINLKNPRLIKFGMAKKLTLHFKFQKNMVLTRVINHGLRRLLFMVIFSF